MLPPPSPGAYGGAGPLEMGLTWSLAVIGTIVTIARTHVSVRTFDRVGWDLFWAILTYMTCMLNQAMQTVAAAYGIGNHQWLLTHEDFTIGSKWNWIGRLVGIVAATFGKNTIIALLLRIQGTTHKRKSWVLHFVWISNAALATVVIVVLCLRCKPVALWWDKSLPGTCNAINSKVTETLGLFLGSWQAASDVALAIYPIFIFWPLQMSWKKKAGLSALMGGGLIAGVCAALKTVQVQYAYASKDVSYSVYPLLITTLVECWMIQILAAIPPLRHLFAKALQHSRAVLTRSSFTGTKASEVLPSSHGTIQLTSLTRGSRDWKHWHNTQQKETKRFENDSEEEILTQAKPKGSEYEYSERAEGGQFDLDAGITVTRDYTVRYEKNGGTSDVGNRLGKDAAYAV